MPKFNLLLIYWSIEDVWLSWLAYCGWFTREEVTRQLHIMAQARESSPVIDRRSNHYAKPW